MLSIVSSLPRSGSVSLENWNSPCILAQFPPTQTPIQTALYDSNTADNNFVCLSSSADRSKTPHLATIYDKKKKIPIVSFKKYACANIAQCSWCSNIKRGNHFSVTKEGVTKEMINGDRATLYVRNQPPNHSILGLDKIERGHLLASDLGAGLLSASAQHGSEATFSMYNVVPQFRSTNGAEGAWRHLEREAKDVIHQCVTHVSQVRGTFYLVSGVNDYQNKEYVCGNCKYDIVYEGKNGPREDCCLVKDKLIDPTTQRPDLSRNALSFPHQMWMAGCCYLNGKAFLFHGIVANSYRSIKLVNKVFTKVDHLPTAIQDLFKGTICATGTKDNFPPP